MIDRIRQFIFGNNNYTAGRDLIINHPLEFNIRFYDKDIKEIITFFEVNSSSISTEIDDVQKFYRPNIFEKNRINNLSPDYFRHIQLESLNDFYKIYQFLNNPENEEFKSKYLETTKEINRKIVCNRRDFSSFEKIFEAIYDFIVINANYKLSFDKDLIWIFLHFMYYNCDIGDKVD